MVEPGFEGVSALTTLDGETRAFVPLPKAIYSRAARNTGVSLRYGEIDEEEQPRRSSDRDRERRV
jgi:hypothetical protein